MRAVVDQGIREQHSETETERGIGQRVGAIEPAPEEDDRRLGVAGAGVRTPQSVGRAGVVERRIEHEGTLEMRDRVVRLPPPERNLAKTRLHAGEHVRVGLTVRDRGIGVSASST